MGKSYKESLKYNIIDFKSLQHSCQQDNLDKTFSHELYLVCYNS